MKAALPTRRRDTARARAGSVAVMLAVLAVAAPSAARAATFQVTKTVDTADGSCDSDCSVREAVIAANADPDGDTVRLSPGHHTLSIEGMGEDRAATGDLDIRAAVTIRGSGADRTSLDGRYIDRVLHTPRQGRSSFTATVSALAITRGGERELETSVYGGGIRNEARRATLNLGGVAVRRNTASYGGGVLNEGAMTIARSTVSDQRVYGRSTGGGIANAGDLTLVNSTVSRNSSAASAGISHRAGMLTIGSSTIAFNQSSRYNGDAAGIDANRGGLTLRNTIVARNHFTDSGLRPDERIANCWGTVRSGGHNLENGTTCGFTRPSDVRADPRLGPLQNNGGATSSHALLRGSPAIDAAGAPFPRVDQRGVARPQGKTNDIGAFERRQR